MKRYLCKITMSKTVEVYIDAPDEDYLDDEVDYYITQNHPGFEGDYEVEHYIDLYEPEENEQ